MTSIDTLLKSIKLSKQKNKDGITYSKAFEEAGVETVEDIAENITTKEEFIEYLNPKPIHLKKMFRELENKYNIKITSCKQPGSLEKDKEEHKEEHKQEGEVEYPERKNWKGKVTILNEPSLVNEMEKNKRQMKQKTLLIIGETGVGKSTLINSMVNYLYGVKFNDTYKLQLINEDKLLEQAKKSKTSVTQTLTQYTVTPSIKLLDDYIINILDTPGFGDTGGYHKDEQIFDDITSYFKNKINSITAICIVVKSSDTRSTITQQYIFSRLFSLFGKDVEKNIYVLCTFASLNVPPCIEVLKSDKINCPFEKYFKFDNSAFFIKKAKNKQKLTVQSLYYDIGIESFNEFFTYVKKKKDVPLQLTKKKFTKEERLKHKIRSVRDNIKQGVDNVNSFEDLKQQIKTTKSHKNKLKDKIKYPFKKTRYIKKNTTPGEYTTICNHCKWTCHDDCSIPPNRKQDCCAMKSNGYCSTCPDGCHHSSHTNESYLWVPETYTVMVTNDEILKDYNEYDSNLSVQENMLNSVEKTLNTIRKNIKQGFADIQTLNRELKKMSLRYQPVTQEQYLIMLIKKEEKDMQDGWKGRCDTYQGIIDEIRMKGGELKGSDNLDKIFQTNKKKKKSSGFFSSWW